MATVKGRYHFSTTTEKSTTTLVANGNINTITVNNINTKHIYNNCLVTQNDEDQQASYGTTGISDQGQQTSYDASGISDWSQQTSYDASGISDWSQQGSSDASGISDWSQQTSYDASGITDWSQQGSSDASRISDLDQQTSCDVSGISDQGQLVRYDNTENAFQQTNDGDVSLIANLKPGMTATLCVKILCKSALKTNRKGQNYIFLIIGDLTGKMPVIAAHGQAVFVQHKMVAGNVYIMNIIVDAYYYKHMSMYSSYFTIKGVLNTNSKIEACKGMYSIDEKRNCYGQIIDACKSRKAYEGCPNINCTFQLVYLTNGSCYFCPSCKSKFSEPQKRFKIFFKIMDLETNTQFAAFAFHNTACQLLHVHEKTFTEMFSPQEPHRFTSLLNRNYNFTILLKVNSNTVQHIRILEADPETPFNNY